MTRAINGIFVNGWRFNNGKESGKISALSQQQTPFILKNAPVENCDIIYIVLTTYHYTDWYVNGSKAYTSYNGTTSQILGSYSSCSGCGKGGGGYEYSYTTSYSSNNLYTFTGVAGDKFFKTSFSQTMETQIANMCVPSIMEYINHELCGGNMNQGSYTLDYLQTYGLWIMNEGVDFDKIIPFVENHFYTSIFTANYKTQIDQGCIIMTDMATDITGTTHNVAVVGYTDNNQLIYMDPERGYLMKAPVSHFGLNYTIPIRACKTTNYLSK